MSSLSEQRQPRISGDRLLAVIWVSLLCLTLLTILVARIQLGYFNILAALAIAITKSLLVIFFFMHLNQENRLLKWLLCVAVLLLAIFIGMTFFDVAFRTVVQS